MHGHTVISTRSSYHPQGSQTERREQARTRHATVTSFAWVSLSVILLYAVFILLDVRKPHQDTCGGNTRMCVCVCKLYR